MNPLYIILIISTIFFNTVIILISMSKVLTHLEHRITKLETVLEIAKNDINNIYNKKCSGG